MDVLILLLGYAIAIVGGYGINEVLAHYTLPAPEQGLHNAGLVIGMLERVLVLTFVIVGEYAAIGIIFAAKSIARYSELSDRRMAEYYLIGTLLSLTLAVVTGVMVTLACTCP